MKTHGSIQISGVPTGGNLESPKINNTGFVISQEILNMILTFIFKCQDENYSISQFYSEGMQFIMIILPNCSTVSMTLQRMYASGTNI